jgi:hypothetical protein
MELEMDRKSSTRWLLLPAAAICSAVALVALAAAVQWRAPETSEAPAFAPVIDSNHIDVVRALHSTIPFGEPEAEAPTF